MGRLQNLTEPVEYKKRLEHWHNQLKSIDEQLDIAKRLKEEGMALINSMEEVSTREVAKTLQIVVASIELGINIENECHKLRTELLLHKPEEE